jgi:hypothetical protein
MSIYLINKDYHLTMLISELTHPSITAKSNFVLKESQGKGKKEEEGGHHILPETFIYMIINK